MQAKLTLRMDEELIAEAKQIAKENGKSVSRMFADYIKQFQIKNNRKDGEIEKPLSPSLSPLTQQLVGLLANVKVDEDIDAKAIYHEHLDEKYAEYFDKA